MFKYPVELIEDDGTILVKFPDIPEAITFGKTQDEALANAVGALETALMTYVEKRWPLPKQSQLNKRPGVSPTLLSCLKLALHDGMIEKNLKKTDLARLLSCHMPQVDRLLDLNHASRLGHLERALAAINRYLVVEVRDLAA